MAVWSEVDYRNLPNIRLDAEYYQPHFFHAIGRLHAMNAVPVFTFADVTDGIHASPEWVDGGGVRYLSAKCVKDNYFVLDGAGQISVKQDEANPRTRARLNDVLLTTVGTIGHAAVVNEEVLPANMDRHLGIIRIRPEREDVDPYYLSLFFNTLFGRAQTLREATGNVQLNLFVDSIKRLLVPLGEDLNSCGRLVRQAYNKRLDSKSIYAEAESLLIDALNLRSQPNMQAITYERDFQAVAHAGRFDAQYYHAGYMTILDRVRNSSHRVLGKHARISSGYAWRSEYFQEESQVGEPFVRIRDCKPGTINNADLTRLDAAYARGEEVSKASPGDLVVGMDGVNYFYASLLREATYVNQRVCSVTLGPDAPFSAEYVMLVLNSQVGQAQLLRQMTIAHTVGHITNEDVRNLLIPMLTERLRDEISRKVKESISALDDAQELVETAKRRVEQRIEGGG